MIEGWLDTTKNVVTITDFAYYAVNVNVAVTAQMEIVLCAERL